jgi:hypothetical protein
LALAPGISYRFLLGAMQQNQIALTVRFMAVDHEVQRLPEITAAWRAASARMQALLNEEPGAADRAVVEQLAQNVQARLAEIQADPLFQASFSDVPTTIGLVEIDSMVAPQREVNLDYVAVLRERLAGDTSLPNLVEFCLATREEAPDIRAIQNSQNQMTFSSQSLDLRFLGGFPKRLTENDIQVAHAGGRPVTVITLLVGFGAAPINGWLAGQRFVLANGFHRVFALRSEGVTSVPVAVRHVANPQIEFPEQYLGLSRSYLLEYRRPVLIRDFLDGQLTVEVRLKSRRKVLRVSWGPEDSIVPE